MFKKMLGYPNMEDIKGYHKFVRMDHDMFEEMVERLIPRIQNQDTNMRRALEPGLKLAITLRFLATGDSYVPLGYGFRVALNTRPIFMQLGVRSMSGNKYMMNITKN